MLDDNRLGPGFVLIEYTGYFIQEPDGDADWTPGSGITWANGLNTNSGLVCVDATQDNEVGAVEVWVEFASPTEIAPPSRAVVTFPARMFYLAGFTADAMRELEVTLPTTQVALTISRKRINPEDQVVIDEIEVTERHVIRIFQRWADSNDVDEGRLAHVLAGVVERGKTDWVQLAEVRNECVDAGFMDPYASAVAIALGMHANGSAELGHYEFAGGFIPWAEQGAAASFRLANALSESRPGTDRPPMMSIMLKVKGV